MQKIVTSDRAIATREIERKRERERERESETEREVKKRETKKERVRERQKGRDLPVLYDLAEVGCTVVDTSKSVKRIVPLIRLNYCTFNGGEVGFTHGFSCI